MNVVPAILMIFFALHVPGMCQYQDCAVHWSFEVTRVNPDEVTLSLTAEIAPGWHIFSQFLKTEGLQPTKFIFRKTGDYLLMGNTVEAGNTSCYYDHRYAKEVMQYSGTATFLQRAKINPWGTTIRGTVEYMACDHRIRMPGKQQFSIELPVVLKMP
jgi:thiol:disulfide interchange protein DsbD